MLRLKAFLFHSENNWGEWGDKFDLKPKKNRTKQLLKKSKV